MRSTSLTSDVTVGKYLDFTNWSISSNDLTIRGAFDTITTRGRYGYTIFYPDGTSYVMDSPVGYDQNTSNRIIPITKVQTNYAVPSGSGVYQWRIFIYDFDNHDIVLYDATISVGINDIEKETIFIGEYDYTEQFDNLVENSTTTINIMNRINNTVSDISEFCSQNHALLFVIMCTGLAFIIKKMLKGVI